jgi:Ca2+-binding RTX toxin-like protein
MHTTRLRRTGVLLTAAAVLASLAAATVAGPVSAAKPRCTGLKATIVDTAKGEVILGTKKRDVIVAKGGHDRVFGRGGNDIICGGPGHDRVVGAGGKDIIFGGPGRDRLYGGPRKDRLLGGPANDRLAGGPGNDACLQGGGTGLRIGCERPVIVPPPPPEPISLTDVKAIAYADLNKNHTPDDGDVMIAMLVDTDGNGLGPGDEVVMGMYPTKLNPVWPTDFVDWRIKSHAVATLNTGQNWVFINTAAGHHRWYVSSAGLPDTYDESVGVVASSFLDDPNGIDRIHTHTDSPSLPVSAGATPVRWTVNR